MGEGDQDEKRWSERPLEHTPTWAVAVVFFVLIGISIFIEHIIYALGKWLTKKHKKALCEALENIKAEREREGDREECSRNSSSPMAGGDQVEERTLEQTPTWAVAVVFFVLIGISIFIEHIIHAVGKWLTRKHKRALYEALEKVKAELMLMGFISLMLTILQSPISNICVSQSVANTWHPCSEIKTKSSDLTVSGNRRRLLVHFSSTRRSLATKGYDTCAEKGQVAFVSAYGIHQLHIFIFVLAVFHIIYGITTLALGRTKMKKWKAWEKETKTIEYQYCNDPERFRFARDTSFGRRHLNIWSKTSVSLWIVCFFRQFFGSVTKVDYLTLRHGFIMAHLAPGSETRFDFQKYIKRSLEKDFKVVVGISEVLWFVAMLFLLTNTHGWFSYLWLPFIPLIIILLVGAKLQVIITKLGLRIQERGDVVKGAPVVQPGDELFWFGNPRFILYLIHLVLFQNAFQLAFFIWSTYEFGIDSCFHKKLEDIIIRVSMGVIIHILCSYVTLPLYALVTQMGSTMKPTIFNDRVAAALKNWHQQAKKQTRHGRSEATTPYSSRPTTPRRSTASPVHLLQNYPHRSLDSFPTSPTHSNRGNIDHLDPESLRQFDTNDSEQYGHFSSITSTDQDTVPFHQFAQEQSSSSTIQLPSGPRAQEEMKRSLSDFSFAK